tara:strand:+ start:409 stop:1149 length:741 start_codon:yes stop_codon:yes gene_type:complete
MNITKYITILTLSIASIASTSFGNDTTNIPEWKEIAGMIGSRAYKEGEDFLNMLYVNSGMQYLVNTGYGVYENPPSTDDIMQYAVDTKHTVENAPIVKYLMENAAAYQKEALEWYQSLSPRALASIHLTNYSAFFFLYHATGESLYLAIPWMLFESYQNGFINAYTMMAVAKLASIQISKTLCYSASKMGLYNQGRRLGNGEVSYSQRLSIIATAWLYVLGMPYIQESNLSETIKAQLPEYIAAYL